MSLMVQAALAREGLVKTNVVPRHRSRIYEAQIAATAELKQDVFRLRYNSYLQAGYIEPNATRTFRDKFDDEANTVSILVRQDGSPIAAVRVCFLAQPETFRSPARDTYPDEVARLIAAHGTDASAITALEVNRLVRSPAAENNQGLIFMLYRLAGYLALRVNFGLFISCVRQNHIPFYRRLGFEVSGPPRPYPGLSCCMQLLSLTRDAYDDARAATAILDPDAGETSRFDGFECGETVRLPLIP